MKENKSLRSPLALVAAGMMTMAVAAAGLMLTSRAGPPALAAPVASAFQTADNQPAPTVGRSSSTASRSSSPQGRAANTSTANAPRRHSSESTPADRKPSTTQAAARAATSSTASPQPRTPSTPSKESSTAAAMAPNQVWIPSVNTRVAIVAEGQSGGLAAIPSTPGRVGWMDWTPSLGAPAGTVVIAGHVTFNNVPGSFYRLPNIKPGAVVYTSNGAGTVQAWRVQSANAYPKGKLPASVWSSTGPRRLALITCTGNIGLVPKQGGYAHLDNLVVLAAPVATR
ncbi:class F sortase [Flexivirga caeni]|uniref:Class F sortase n=1 Tax=Flexivirga caeni TaxID=2294115 RepID=A0A3M9MGW7_9MICO|nr:class F sortase [Flexivirga caeni]RNI24810.1 class F sortase [Flexivirga caeni]